MTYTTVMLSIVFFVALVRSACCGASPQPRRSPRLAARSIAQAQNHATPSIAPKSPPKTRQRTASPPRAVRQPAASTAQVPARRASKRVAKTSTPHTQADPFWWRQAKALCGYCWQQAKNSAAQWTQHADAGQPHTQRRRARARYVERSEDFEPLQEVCRHRPIVIHFRCFQDEIEPEADAS